MLNRFALPLLLALTLTSVLIAQDSGAVARLLGKTDTSSNLVVRMGANSGSVQARGAIGSLFGKVDSNGALYVTQDSTVPATMGNPALFGEGTGAAPSIAFAADPTKGIFSCGVNCIGIGEGGAELFRFSTSGASIESDVIGLRMGVGNDAQIGRSGQGMVYVGTATSRPIIDGTFFVSTTQVCTAADLNPTTAFTYSLPAGALSSNGRGVHIAAYFFTAANANTKTIAVNFGASNVGGRTAAADNNQTIRVETDIVRTGAATQFGFIQTYVSTLGSTAAQNTFTSFPGGLVETMANAITINAIMTNGVATATDICFRYARITTIQ